MYDPTEANERGIKKPRYSTKHPYAAIEHRVIDSPAYADLTYAARGVLQIFARQLSKDNNGHLQGTLKYLSRFGIGSQNTISQAIKQLVSHGMLYRTRCGGYQVGASLYAVTWLPIKRKEGLFLEGFQLCAWRHWSTDKKTPPRNLQELRCRNGIRERPTDAESASERPPKTAHNELIPVVLREDEPCLA